MTLQSVEDGKLHRALAFIARKDGAINQSRSVRGNANVNLVQLSVALFILVAFNSWKMAIENTANCVANVLDLILTPIGRYTCIRKGAGDIIVAVQVDRRLEVIVLCQARASTVLAPFVTPEAFTVSGGTRQ